MNEPSWDYGIHSALPVRSDGTATLGTKFLNTQQRRSADLFSECAVDSVEGPGRSGEKMRHLVLGGRHSSSYR
jgi:hypothetical protein